MKKIKHLQILMLVIIPLMMSSCSTLFTGTKQTVQISSKPPGAKILVDGIDRGTTPSMVKLKKCADGQTITLKLDGYETKNFQPQTSFNAVSILNLFNVFFWGIDVVSGAVYKYDPKFYDIELDKNK
jgi:hypothetical protein